MPRKAQILPILVVATALIAGCATSNSPDQGNADASAPARSLNSDTPALITFVNRSGQPVNVYWLDFGGNRKFYQTLGAGSSYTQQIFLTHPWLVTDAKDHPWHTYLPEAKPRTVELQAPSETMIAR